MDRKKFIKTSLLAGTLGTIVPSILKADAKENINTQVGFNHLPNKEIKTMKTVVHKANTRGQANHGWLQSYHSFSFASYYNPHRMNFGAIRVLNDDIVKGGQGFGTHPHQNMEIISIPLEGDLEHKDSMDNTVIINEGDVQAMSAGTGIYHSEYNKNKDKEVKFLQIWVVPNKKDVIPKFDQISIRDLEKHNDFYQILSPNKEDDGVWIHQDAWFHMGKFENNKEASYQIKKSGNGIYAFVLEGKVEIEGQTLEKRDGFGVWDVESIALKSNTKSKILLMEVPMSV